MTKSVTITARITPSLARKIVAYAKAAKRTKSQAVEIILEENIEREMAFIEAVNVGIRELDEGKGIPHDQAMKEIHNYIAKRKRERRRAA